MRQEIRPGEEITHAIVAAFVAAFGVAACGGGGSTVPNAPDPGPSGPGNVVAIVVGCLPTIVPGQQSPCVAYAQPDRGDPLPVLQSAWSSSRPDVATVDAFGLVTGRSPGQSVISLSYAGRQGTAAVTVTAEDTLRIVTALENDFRRGMSATSALQVEYAVASQQTGRLSLRISDQDGSITITTASAMTVPRGGNVSTLFATFVVPQTSTQICRTVVLEVGSITIEQPQSNGPVPRCIPVRP